jgi:hypothetical protein
MNGDDSLELDANLVVNSSIYSKKKDNVFANHLNEDEMNYSKFKNEQSIDVESSNFHHVQVIDEDVENFTRRLDILVKNFKTDSLKDFMSIKRNLLKEQKNIIGTEKQKSDTIINNKNDEIEKLSFELNNTKNALAREISVKEKISAYLYNYRIKIRNSKLKKSGFSSLKDFLMKKKINAYHFNRLRHYAIMKYKSKAFGLILENYKECKNINIIMIKEKEFQVLIFKYRLN